MNKKIKIIIALVTGFVIAMMLMGVAIYFGYTKAYSIHVDALTVRILGIPIYELTKAGSEYAGKTMGTYMGIFCGICMILAFSIEEIISKIRCR